MLRYSRRLMTFLAPTQLPRSNDFPGPGSIIYALPEKHGLLKKWLQDHGYELRFSGNKWGEMSLLYEKEGKVVKVLCDTRFGHKTLMIGGDIDELVLNSLFSNSERREEAAQRPSSQKNSREPAYRLK